jgi:hypothetical protein
LSLPFCCAAWRRVYCGLIPDNLPVIRWQIGG